MKKTITILIAMASAAPMFFPTSAFAAGWINPETGVISYERESSSDIPYKSQTERKQEMAEKWVKDTSGLYKEWTVLSPEQAAEANRLTWNGWVTATTPEQKDAAAKAAAEKSGGSNAATWDGKKEEKKTEEESFVYVTERIPGANCTLKEWSATTVDKRLYRCTVWQGFDTVTGMLGSLIRYATYLTGLIGVLMIVLSWIQYSLSGGGEDAKKAKGRIIQLATWLVLLFLTGMILNTIAPWIYN